MSSPGDDKANRGSEDHKQDDLSETKRIMERLVRTPPKPRRPSVRGEEQKPEKRRRSK